MGTERNVQTKMNKRTYIMIAFRSNPTAVIAANDLMAVGAIRAVKDHGFHVP